MNWLIALALAILAVIALFGVFVLAFDLYDWWMNR